MKKYGNCDNICKMLGQKSFFIILLAILFLIAGCGNTTNTASTNTELNQTLQSSDNLKRNCQFKIAESMDSFKDEGLEVGSNAIDFTLKDAGGNEVNLSDLLSEKPVVMVLGSFT